MPENDTSEEPFRLEISSKAKAIEFINHHVNVASKVEVVKNASDGGFSGTVSGFADDDEFVDDTADTEASAAQAKTAAAEKINADAAKVTLTKQANGKWTVV